MKIISRITAGMILACIALGALCYIHNEFVREKTMWNRNVEALSGDESLDCNYNRREESCEFLGNAKIRILGVGVIKVNGSFSIPGVVVCSTGGNETCKPVECIDLYEVIK